MWSVSGINLNELELLQEGELLPPQTFFGTRGATNAIFDAGWNRTSKEILRDSFRNGYHRPLYRLKEE